MPELLAKFLLLANLALYICLVLFNLRAALAVLQLPADDRPRGPIWVVWGLTFSALFGGLVLGVVALVIQKVLDLPELDPSPGSQRLHDMTSTTIFFEMVFIAEVLFFLCASPQLIG